MFSKVVVGLMKEKGVYYGSWSRVLILRDGHDGTEIDANPACKPLPHLSRGTLEVQSRTRLDCMDCMACMQVFPNRLRD